VLLSSGGQDGGIPKKDGRVRLLGIPTVADRVAQMVAKMYLEPVLEPTFIRTPMGTDLENQRFKQSKSHGDVAGSTTGCLRFYIKGM